MSVTHRRKKSRPAGPRRTIRRSFALPAKLVEQVSEAAPPEHGGNLNAIVRTALEEYVERHRNAAFAEEMRRMAGDPQIRAVNADLNEAFRGTLMDGVSDDSSW